MTVHARPGSDPARAFAGVRFLRTFDGTEPTPGILAAIRAGHASGVTLFRARNVGSPAQVRELSARLQAARPAGDPPLVIGLDQEGGQLQAVGNGATAWPGNLALGATRSPDLAARAGRAIGAEAAAMGATLVFAPVCDLLYPASATPLGTRPFGSDAAMVGELAAAMTRGLQGAGVMAVLKHFPGHGAAEGDSHLATPIVRRSGDELRARDLRPFVAGIAAGAAAVLPGHLAAPALTHGVPIPATISRVILDDVLRGELGFTGITVSDAMDMGGAGGAERLSETLVAAAEAGMDLFTMAHAEDVEEAAFDAFVAALGAGRLDRRRLELARDRIFAARRALDALAPGGPVAGGPVAGAPDRGQPPIELVGCADHLALAREIARASVTLVRDPAGHLPLRLGADARVAFIAPVPVDLTPAETSSYLRIGLAEALRERGVRVDELVAPLDPTPAQARALAAAAAGHDAVIVGMFDAVSFPGQVRLLDEVAAAGRPGRRCVGVALRTPYDAALAPDGIAAVCTYGIQAPQMEALADALLGRIPFSGALPVELPASERVQVEPTPAAESSAAESSAAAASAVARLPAPTATPVTPSAAVQRSAP
jgi:beta-N-acetylhexosaminidase